jgi:hypothetical protein
MIAMAGLLTFAWSTGVLLTIAQDFQDQQMQLLKRRREKHRPQTVSAEAATSSPAAPPAVSGAKRSLFKLGKHHNSYIIPSGP